MNESPREKKILDVLANGQTVHIGSSQFGPFSQPSLIALNQVRQLTSKELEPPLGREKILNIIQLIGPLLNNTTTEQPIVSRSGEQNQGTRKLKLSKVIAQNFRGLQRYGGPEFSFEFTSDSYLITGVNGTGKSSLLNAIVWALSGQLLWDRSLPAAPTDVDLKYFSTQTQNLGTIKAHWPSHIAIPDLSMLEGGNPQPSCWVELHLGPDDGSTPIVIRRESRPAKGDLVSGLESIDPVSIDVSVLMPGRVNHIQFNKESEIGKILIQISGLESLDKYGTYVTGLRAAFTKYINELEDSAKSSQNELQLVSAELLRSLPQEVAEGYQSAGSSERNLVARADLKISWLENTAINRLANLVNILNLEQQPSAQELGQLGKNILVAFENVREQSPDTWRTFTDLAKAISDWDSNAADHWNNELDETKQNFRLALEWYQRQRESAKLRLILVACQLIAPDIEPDQCPLCEQNLPPDHNLRRELPEYQQSKGAEVRNIVEVLNNLRAKLLKALPLSFSSIKAASPGGFVLQAFDDHISPYLKGSLEPLVQLGKKSLENIINGNGSFDWITHDTSIEPIDLSEFEPSVRDMILELIREISMQSERVQFVEWAKEHFPSVKEQIDISLGFTSSESLTLLKVLSQANEIAEAVKPLQEAIKNLEQIRKCAKAHSDTMKKLEIVKLVRSALLPLDILKNLSDSSLVADIENVEAELQHFYGRLYSGEDFPLRKVSSKRVNRNILFSFWVGYRNVVVEAAPFLNSSRIRALLWSYVFALSKVGNQSSSGDWLDFTLIDEPLTSLDQEHQRSFASVVFDTNSAHQYIVTSHDLRWPRELKRLTSQNIDAQYHSCYGISNRDVIRIEKWLEESDRKWEEWHADESDIEKGRDYVASSREWCENELKDILVWASVPSLPRDTLGDLIRKIEHAQLNDPLYKIDACEILHGKLREIETDLQNSHHGCSERNRIMKNEISRVHKVMVGIASSLETLQKTLLYRLRKDNIV
ncbi:AAA family ATPase [Desulfosporosinus metallidurans]|uniref:Nuclease SbcCD subunit C n=1 Tax=Desulfosporosinus metallidurans TaxID=1888891 RepID=A0A1Q8QGN0_9FIRM|nr:ATP-binding protein [Desulfosporosinus metallidurans]OLN26496.1 hypothetical protein DSOL_4977 [Desulfosporosinus metallidurans]